MMVALIFRLSERSGAALLYQVFQDGGHSGAGLGGQIVIKAVAMGVDGHGQRAEPVQPQALQAELFDQIVSWSGPGSGCGWNAMPQAPARSPRLGAQLCNRFDFWNYIRSEAADYLQSDVWKAGGITEFPKIAALGA
jgi:hypothetical protein